MIIIKSIIEFMNKLCNLSNIKSMKIFVIVLIFSSFIIITNSECHNGCSGHGNCEAWDMCLCWRNWQGNDCSDRICGFGRAFVDSPKGDLDYSGKMEGPEDPFTAVNSNMFPYGTTEQFPLMEDSDQNVVTQSAHDYSECSNAGLCNRKTGVCDCFPGFAGGSCERIECPKDPHGLGEICSGHGICRNANRMAHFENDGSVYKLWDKTTIYGCACDKGWFGGDCSQRKCKIALDPLYLDDVQTISFPTYYFALLTTSNTYDFTDGAGGVGKWSIRFYDINGDEWLTSPITIGASCSDVIATLENLPRGVIPKNSLTCSKSTVHSRYPLDRGPEWEFTFYNRYRFYFVKDDQYGREESMSIRPIFWDAGYKSSFANANATEPDDTLTGDIYRIEFMGNPGYIPQPLLELNYDGHRPSLKSAGKMLAKSWTDGRQGDTKDYFAIHCPKVKVNIQFRNGIYYLNGYQSPQEKESLKACVGFADDDDTNDVRNTYGKGDTMWDYGSILNPHPIRLSRSITNYQDGGFYALIFYDTSIVYDSVVDYIDENGTQYGGTFRLLNPFKALDGQPVIDTQYFEVYGSKGHTAVAGDRSEATFDFASKQIFVTNTSYDVLGQPYALNDGDNSCESKIYEFGPHNACLELGDMFFLVDPMNVNHNPPFINLYTVTSMYKTNLHETSPLVSEVHDTYRDQQGDMASHKFVNLINTDVATNWAADASGPATFRVYKFFPPKNDENVYELMAECANRGVCNYFEGICDCFKGYTGDGCANHDTVSV